jgi:UDP-MurNAc hydroxylase
MANTLQFLNHASFLIEADDFVLVCDPWIEGTAFNNGWSLLDQSTSNAQLLQYLEKQTKKIFLWYSHEHSDHFAIHFLKQAKSKEIPLHVIFQTTEDKRVTDFLEKEKFTVSVLSNGEQYDLGKNSSIRVWAWKSGDSFSLIDVDGTRILNLNDCIVKNTNDAEKARHWLSSSGVDHIDILFTQFGYANWCGNEDDAELRESEAAEHCLRIGLQIRTLEPKSVVLFASFIYFSHPDNFYLNDAQNTPEKIRSNESLKGFQSLMYFMKPGDEINLDDDHNKQLNNRSGIAEHHWQKSYRNCKPSDIDVMSPVCREDLKNQFDRYKSRVTKNFLGLFSILELCGFLQPLRIRLTDDSTVVTLSYIKSFSSDSRVAEYDLAMRSDVLSFSIINDYGFDTTHINGRFRTGDSLSNWPHVFFIPQNLLKNGFGVRKPIPTLKELLRLVARKWK